MNVPDQALMSQGSSHSELADLTRIPDPTSSQTGGFAKSRKTRLIILEAVLDSVATAGFSATSLPAIARAAGLTKPTLLYHFPSKLKLMAAAVHYLTRKLVDGYSEMMSQIPKNDEYFDHAVQIGWEQLAGRDFAALAEFRQAARSNPELSAVVGPAMVEYDRARRVCAHGLAPDAGKGFDWFDLRCDIIRFLGEGLAVSGEFSFDTTRRKEEVVKFLKLLCSESEGVALLEKARQK